MPQPIQPSVRKMFAQFLATADPRCGFEEHNKVAQGDTCIRCRRDLMTYLEVVPQEWPV